MGRILMLKRKFSNKKKVDPFVSWKRKIIHVDMDAFFASIEQRNRPHLKGEPVVVGGDPKSRGVVSAASYEARKFGIRSAMPSYQAFKKCPEAIFIKPDIECYRAVSSSIMKIFSQHTDLVEPISLDEAYLDVSSHKLGLIDPVMIAKMIKDSIFAKTALTASAGIAPNMFLAKVASNHNKPDGLTVIHLQDAESFLADLPVRIIPGIGPVAEKKLATLNIQTCADLTGMDRSKGIRFFGKIGPKLIDMARGVDDRKVEANLDQKQISSEVTFEQDLIDLEAISKAIENLCREVTEAMAVKGIQGKTMTLKVKYSNFQVINRSFTTDRCVWTLEECCTIAKKLLKDKTEAGQRPVRLIGIGFSNFQELTKQHPPEDLFELK